jgi:PPOX class probable F420-dependent enzyme
VLSVTDAAATRPHIPGYGLPEDTKGLLDVSHLEETLKDAKNLWVCTVRPDGRPHAMPVWGVWVDGRIHFGGGPDTRKARNIRQNPNVIVHSESGERVAVIEGTAQVVEDDAYQERIDDAYEAKYNMRHGPFVWAVTPTVAFGWTDFTKDATRWTFPTSP